MEVARGDLLAQELAREQAEGLLVDGPLPVEQVGDDDDGELQPLRLVEGHEADAVDVLGQLHAGRQLAAGRLVGVEIGDEAREGPGRVLGLPVGREAHEARDVDDGALGLQGAGRQEVQDHAGSLEVALQDGVRALAPGERVELLDGGQQGAQPGPKLRRGVVRVPLRGGDVHQGGAAVEVVQAADAQDLQGVQSPRAGGHHADEGGAVVGVRDGAQALLQVPDLGRLEQAQAAHHGVRDVLVPEPRHDGVAVLVLAIQDGDVVAAAAAPLPRERLDGVDDGDGLVLGACAAVELHRDSLVLVGPEALVRLEAGLVAPDQAVGGLDDVADGAEVLVDAEAAGTGGMVRAPEPDVELREGGIAGPAEAVDGLVVVAHHHHVGGTVRGAAEELDELDLGDVGVLELVHEDVPELALPSPEDVGAGLEQAGHEGDLLAEVQGTARGQGLLVGAVDAGDLGQAQDLEGGAVALVVHGEGVDLRVVVGRELVAAVGVAVTRDGTASLAIRDLDDHAGVVLAQLAGVFRPLVRAEARVGTAHLAQGPEVTLGLEAEGGLLEAPVTGLVDPALLGHEAVVVVGIHELVLGPVDEAHEAREGVVRVVAKVQGGSEVPEQEQLADAVQHVGARRQAGVPAAFGEDVLAEAVEVADGHPCARRGTHGPVQALLELLRGLDVVGHHEQLLGDEGALEGVAVPGRGFRGHQAARARPRGTLRVQEPPHALHDDARLPRPGARDDHEGAIVRLDDGALLGGELLSGGGACGGLPRARCPTGRRAGQRFGHRTSPPLHACVRSLEGPRSERAHRCKPDSFGRRSVAPLEAGSVPGTGLSVLIRARSSRPAVTGCLSIRAYWVLGSRW